jgi:membrane protein DedA with SNARE-associated domain
MSTFTHTLIALVSMYLCYCWGRWSTRNRVMDLQKFLVENRFVATYTQRNGETVLLKHPMAPIKKVQKSSKTSAND